MRGGADFIIVGRGICRAEDPFGAAESFRRQASAESFQE